MTPSTRWRAGWALGGGVVAVAASLLLALIALARRVTRQAGEIERTLDAARDNTRVLFDISSVNLALDQLTRELRAVREQR